MEEIRRQDVRLWVREMLSPGHLVFLTPLLFVFLVAANDGRPGAFVPALFITVIVLGLYALAAWRASKAKRFREPRFARLWEGCRDRMSRFEEVLSKMKREQVADLREMPPTVRRVSQTLYIALRRADLVAHEVMLSERELLAAPPAWQASSADPQSQELYRLADRNIAEYRAEFAGVMAGVQRTEAQSAVFMTTLDTLRMKMLGYRLVGRSPELRSDDFLEALAEARLQLQSIDHALDELDLGHYPRMVATTSPPPVPDDVRQRLGQ